MKEATNQSNLFEYLNSSISPMYKTSLADQGFKDEDDLIYLYAIGNSCKHVKLRSKKRIIEDIFSLAIYENKNAPLAPFGEELLFDPENTLCTMVVARNKIHINNRDIAVSRSLYILLRRISEFCENHLLK